MAWGRSLASILVNTLDTWLRTVFGLSTRRRVHRRDLTRGLVREQHGGGLGLLARIRRRFDRAGVRCDPRLADLALFALFRRG